jgi:hypothetical protein
MLPVPTSLNISASQGNNEYHHEQFQNEQSITRSETTSLEYVEERFCFMEQLATPHLSLLPLRIWTEAMIEFCLHPVYLPIELGEDLHQGHLSALTMSVVEANGLGLYAMLECRQLVLKHTSLYKP